MEPHDSTEVQREQTVRGGRVLVGLRWAFWAGPLAWLLDLGASYAAAQHACSMGHFYVLHVISLLAFLLAISGALSALLIHRHRDFPEGAKKDGARPRDRAVFHVVV